MEISLKFILVILVHISFATAKEYCPKLCICDIFESYKRADCSDQNLVSPYTNVPNSVEILNLSGNDITEIDNESFEDYTELINLSLARNAIHTIELFAFNMLKKLNYLDLSDNRLEVIDNRILDTNERLTFLDLSKNKFMMVGDQPLIISTSLEYLSLRNSHLSHIYNSFFSEIPNLVDIDVSNNLLITLMSGAFESLGKLQFINLEYNRFSCDYRIEETLQKLKQMKVHVKIDKCVKNSKKPMFEKMILHPDATPPPREDVEIDLLWQSSRSNDNQSEFDTEVKDGRLALIEYYLKIKQEREEDSSDESEAQDCENDEIFPSLCECHHKYIQLFDTTEKSQKLRIERMERHVKFVFYVGIFLGCIAGMVGFYFAYLIWKRCARANKKQIERQMLRNRIIETRIAEASPNRSPVPAIRNQINLPVISEPVVLAQRSPIPAPRHIQPRSNQSTPEVRRRAEPPQRPVAYVPASNARPQYEMSPTAQLIHKLFRNRDLRFSDRSDRLRPIPEMQPLAVRPSASTSSTTRPSVRPFENHYSEIPSAPAPSNISITDDDDDDNSDYLSIDDISLNLNFDDIRTDSVTPPPPYRSIFDDKD